MFSSRLSNRSSFGSRIKKSEITERKLLNSSQYLQLCKSKDENPDQLIFDSLLSYEKQLKTLQGFLVIYESKINHFRKLNSLKEITEFVKNLTSTNQPFNEQEQLVFKPIFKTQKRKECQQLAQLLEQKQQQQRKAQQEFLKALTDQYEEDKMKQTIGVINLQRILNRKLTKSYQDGFSSLSRKISSEKPNEKMIRNILMSSFMMVSIKLKSAKQMAFKTLMKQYGLGSIVDQIDTSLKVKGKALMALKQYPRLNLKRAFWRWHLSTTDQGQKLFKRASDKLVLYTNINKTSFFYRLYNQVRVKQIKVDPKVKRMTVMFYLYTKIFFERPMRTFFEKTKIFTANSGKQNQLTQNMVICSQMRQKDLFKKWLNKAKQIKEQQKSKKVMMQNLAKRIVQVSKQKKLYLIQGWKKVTLQKIKQNKLKQFYLKKLFNTKTGRLVQAFNNWKMLPQKINLQAFKRISRFEKGLINFAQRTLKRALESFKSEYQKGQTHKKRAVIQLINITQGGQKRYFNKWKTQVIQHLLYQRCQILGKVFENTKNSLNRNFAHLYQMKQYNLRQVSVLQRFFTNLNDNTDKKLLQTFDKLKENAKFNRVNKWFYKSAQLLALKSHITVHKSFLRLKHNAVGKVTPINDLMRIKLQKLCCNMKKHYQIILYRAFITIQKFVKSHQQKNESLITRNTNASQLTTNNHSLLLKQESIISGFSSSNEVNSLREQFLLQTNQRVSVNLCENVFNQNVKKQINKWRQNISPGKQFIESNSIILQQNPDLKSHIHKLKASIQIMEKLSTKRLLTMSLGFRLIIQQAIRTRSTPSQQQQDQNLQQRLQLVTKQNALMQKIEQYKKQNEILLQQLQVKQAHLLESNKTVTILSLRINYMVMQKFVSLVEKVVESNIWRSMNQGFDCVIEMANQNFQREQEINEQFVQ